jgi:hypothetical protein
MNLFATLMFASSTMPTSPISQPSQWIVRNEGLPSIGSVINPETGVGCSFWLPKDKKQRKYIYVSTGSAPMMNFNGQNVTLYRTKATSYRQGNSIETYRSGNLKIRIVSKSIDQEGGLSAVFTISKSDQSKTIKAIGYCGC